MTTIPATRARQQWAQTLDEAKKAPVTITEHGRETVVLMDVELSRRALEALEDAVDAHEVEEARARIESGQERTDTLAEVAAGEGLSEEQIRSDFQQLSAVERVIGRHFEPSQINAPTITPTPPERGYPSKPHK